METSKWSFQGVFLTGGVSWGHKPTWSTGVLLSIQTLQENGRKKHYFPVCTLQLGLSQNFSSDLRASEWAKRDE